MVRWGRARTCRRRHRIRKDEVKDEGDEAADGKIEPTEVGERQPRGEAGG